MKYIVAITQNKLYQFIGASDFRTIFEKYKMNQTLLITSCIQFPKANQKGITNSVLQMLYNGDFFTSFGWMSESGFCYGDFNQGKIEAIQNFTVLPYVKINKSGQKEVDAIPLAACHTENHVFVLYNDCVIVISKITSNIIHRQPLYNEKYLNIVYDCQWKNESDSSAGVIWIHTDKKLYSIKLCKEDDNVWQDYLEKGDYSKALDICEKKKLPHSKKIRKLYANYLFEKGDYKNAPVNFAFSDEKFEEVCLKFLKIGEYDGLKRYLETVYVSRIQDKDITQKNLIAVWFVEILLNQLNMATKENEILTLKTELQRWMEDNEKYLDKDTIYQLLQHYGRVNEFIEFAEIKNDFETIILHYINEKDIKSALINLESFLNRVNLTKTQREELKNIFIRYSHSFMKYEAERTINLLERFKSDEIDLNKIISAIMSTDNSSRDKDEKVISYLQNLIRDDKMTEKNIHNLYIFYLAKNNSEEKQEELIEYLKKPIQLKHRHESYKKKTVLFELEYAKKLFNQNYKALSLVLALMGKYTDAVKLALDKGAIDIAKFIAANVDDDKIKKQLWLQIFSSNKNAQFNETLSIMKESEVLKIEDVLPCIMDNIKIEEFKQQISDCINVYEKSIEKLKEDIVSYNDTAEQIKKDIYKVKKRSMEIQYKQCNCEICNKSIKDENIFLFPCGHMFDEQCILDKLNEYANYIEIVREKVDKINQLKNEINKIENQNNEDNTENKRDLKILNFLNFVGTEKKEEKKTLTNEELKSLENIKKNLNDILSEECILCGEYMVESTQHKFDGQKNDWLLI